MDDKSSQGGPSQAGEACGGTQYLPERLLTVPTHQAPAQGRASRETSGGRFAEFSRDRLEVPAVRTAHPGRVGWRQFSLQPFPAVLSQSAAQSVGKQRQPFNFIQIGQSRFFTPLVVSMHPTCCRALKVLAS